jgi:hypothetical protein
MMTGIALLMKPSLKITVTLQYPICHTLKDKTSNYITRLIIWAIKDIIQVLSKSIKGLTRDGLNQSTFGGYEIRNHYTIRVSID